MLNKVIVIAGGLSMNFNQNDTKKKEKLCQFSTFPTRNDNGIDNVFIPLATPMHSISAYLMIVVQ